MRVVHEGAFENLQKERSRGTPPLTTVTVTLTQRTGAKQGAHRRGHQVTRVLPLPVQQPLRQVVVPLRLQQRPILQVHLVQQDQGQPHRLPERKDGQSGAVLEHEEQRSRHHASSLQRAVQELPGQAECQGALSQDGQVGIVLLSGLLSVSCLHVPIQRRSGWGSFYLWRRVGRRRPRHLRPLA